jgi:NAD-dependent deacetylase
MKNKIDEAVDLIKSVTGIVVFSGAGISAESGIPTFRGAGGMWQKYRAEELASYEAFKKNPELVWEFYDYRRQIMAKTKPNNAHLFLSKMERMFDSFNIITQNIDGLHERAGSLNILELHGNIWRVRCEKEKRVFEFRQNPVEPIPPRCKQCGDILRPDVVWFGEALDSDILNKSFELARKAELAIVIGTSSIVYPAAHIPLLTKENGGKILEINIETTPLTDISDLFIKGKASLIINEIFGKLIN